jgi:hypothetical protein
MLRRSSGYFFFFFYLVLDALFEHGGNVLLNPVMIKMVCLLGVAPKSG